jgi:hypothetical protein
MARLLEKFVIGQYASEQVNGEYESPNAEYNRSCVMTRGASSNIK